MTNLRSKQNLETDEDTSCGWGGCCSSVNFFQRFATRGWFIFGTFLLPAGLVAFEQYLAIIGYATSKEAGWGTRFFDYFSLSVIALQSVLALLACSGGGRSNSPLWIGVSGALLGVLCLLAIVPFRTFYETFESPFLSNASMPDITICRLPFDLIPPSSNVSSAWFKMISLCILLLAFSFVNIVNAIHTLSFMIDNKGKMGVAMNIAIFTIVRAHADMLLQMISLKVEKIWLSLLVFGLIFLIFGTLVTLFPTKLKNGAEFDDKSIELADISIHSSATISEDIKDDPGFFSGLKRVSTNKILILDAVVLGLIYSAVKNFTDLKDDFAKTQFHISPTEDYSDITSSTELAKSLKSPFLSLACILFAFMFKSKTNKNIVNFTMGFGFKLPLLLLIISLMRCKVQEFTGVADGNTLMCNMDCHCSSQESVFEPICLKGGQQTYLSPCHAGCKNYEIINNVIIYKDCSCGVNPRIPDFSGSNQFTKGSCVVCVKNWIQFQLLYLVIIIASVPPLIPHLILVFRIIKEYDGKVALGFIIAIVSLVHFFGKLIFKSVEKSTCIYYAHDNYECIAHRKLFTIFIPLISVCFCILAGVISFIIRRGLPKDDSQKDEEQIVTTADETTPLQTNA